MSEHPGKTALAEITGHIDRVNPIPAFRSVNALVLVSIASYVFSLEARLEKAEAELDDALKRADWSEKQLGVALENDGTARDDVLEEAAQNIDCTCDGRDAVLSADSKNSVQRWRACSDVNCNALLAADIRALKSHS